MNKGITLSRLFALCFLLLMTFSCKKEEQEIAPTASTNEISIQDAK